FGIAYGYGVLGNLKRRPWLSALIPMMLASFVHAARDASRDADVVHAHWLPTGWVAARTGKPFVLTLHGSDVALGVRLPALTCSGCTRLRPVRRARRALPRCSGRRCAVTARRLRDDLPRGDGIRQAGGRVGGRRVARPRRGRRDRGARQAPRHSCAARGPHGTARRSRPPTPPRGGRPRARANA